MTFQRKTQYSVEACKMDVISHQLPRYPWDETTMYRKVCTAKSRDGGFAHGYGYSQVPYSKIVGMGMTFVDFVPTRNRYPYPQNKWVGHGFIIAPMGNPMNT